MIRPIDLEQFVIDIRPDMSVAARQRKSGPPERIAGMTFGYIHMDQDSPPVHNGEMHPDGDELLFVIAGRIRVECDSDEPSEIGPGQGCIVPRGGWHNFSALEPTTMIHVTPGPNGEARL